MCDDCTGGVIQNGWQMDAGGADPRDQGCVEHASCNSSPVEVKRFY